MQDWKIWLRVLIVGTFFFLVLHTLGVNTLLACYLTPGLTIVFFWCLVIYRTRKE